MAKGSTRRRSTWQRRPRPWLIVAGALAPVLVGVVAIVVVRPDPPQPRRGSVVAENAPPISFTHTPTSYRIVYRIEERDGTLSTDRVTVRRPFDALVQTYREPPPGETLLSEQVTMLHRLALRSPTSAATILDVAPALSASDQRVDIVLDWALEHGRLQERERRRVYNRPCQVYRAARPLIQGLMTGEITADTYADVCIDEAGLILEEYWVEGGQMVRARVATEVVEDIDVPDATFAMGEATVGVDEGGGTVREITPTAEPPGEFFRLDAPPAGFGRSGRYVVVVPQSSGSGNPVPREHLAVGLVDVYVRGADTLIVDRGGTASGVPPFPAVADALTVEISSLGTAQFFIDTRFVEVRARMDRGRYVRVAGTLPPDELLAVARSLRKVEGNGQLPTS